MYFFYEQKYKKDTIINIGTGKDMRIKDYVNFLIKKLKLKVNIRYDNKKPDGVFRKVLDVNLARKYGWKSKISLEKGFDITYKDFEKTIKKTNEKHSCCNRWCRICWIKFNKLFNKKDKS